MCRGTCHSRLHIIDKVAQPVVVQRAATLRSNHIQQCPDFVGGHVWQQLLELRGRKKPTPFLVMLPESLFQIITSLTIQLWWTGWRLACTPSISSGTVDKATKTPEAGGVRSYPNLQPCPR
eukprot:UN4755